jgi:hypothetical protein
MIIKYNSFLKEDIINSDSKSTIRIVDVEYEGFKHKALAVGYASGPYYKEIYYLLDNKFEYEDFSRVEEASIDSLLYKKEDK